MNTSRQVLLVSLSSLIATLTLAGCGGALNMPDSVMPAAQASGPAIAGKVFGGHAPIQGAHVYLLQPGTAGYGSIATSILGNNGTASNPALTTNSTQKTPDPQAPPAAQFVTTDDTGSFNLTGLYSCTPNQPVYIYSYGGNIGTTTGTTTTPTTVTLNITAAAVTGTSNSGFLNLNTLVNITFTAANTGATPLVAGDTVKLALTNANGGRNWANVNGNQTVLTASATQFTVQATLKFPQLAPTGSATGTATYTANVTNTTTTPPTQNPSSVELVTLGNCPNNGAASVDNFSTGNTAISFIYMNEVSTVATAYTFQPFTLPANNDAWHIGTSGTTQALQAIENAANTAAQLYAIQGNGEISSADDGEGHLANVKTQGADGTPNQGNGTVPQTTIDSLANILAACIDSVPTSSAPTTTCNALFTVATSNGETTGTQPTDTATAAINIARYPAGNTGSGNADPTFVSDIFGIPSNVVPYAPALGAAPNDWTLAITYTGGTIAAANALSPHNIAVDGSGNIYHADFSTNTFTVLSPLGVPTTITKPTTLDGPTSIALDSTSANVWLANQNANTGTTTVTRCTVAGTDCVATALGSNLSEAQDAEIDAAGNIWVTAADTGNGGNVGGGLVEISSATTPAVQQHVTANVDEPTGLSIDATGLIWLADTEEGSAISHCTLGAACTETANTGNRRINVGTNTENTAIDSFGDIWIAGNDTVAAISNTNGTLTSLDGSPVNTGLNNINDGLAIDGNNTVWVANNGSGTVLAFSATSGGTAPVGAVQRVSPAKGYTSSLAPEGIAVDPSGNVWYDTTNGGIVELVGAAAPTVTPLSFAVANNMLGAKP